jgi:hypothetical protein
VIHEIVMEKDKETVKLKRSSRLMEAAVLPLNYARDRF